MNKNRNGLLIAALAGMAALFGAGQVKAKKQRRYLPVQTHVERPFDPRRYGVAPRGWRKDASRRRHREVARRQRRNA